MRVHCFRISSLALLAAAVVTMLAAPLSAGAQVGSTTDIITGKIMSPDGKPIVGARVDATSIETGVTRSRTTNDKGQYTILFPDGGGSYRMAVRYLGFAPATFTLARQADEDRLVADVRMDPVAAQLGPVVVRSSAPTGQGDRPGPGSVERTLTGEQLTRLPIDPTDLAALAALTPGVVALTGTDSTAAGFSVAGQRPDQNQVTLDGLSFLGGTNVPTEAVRQTRVITNTYDVARGQFTGGQVATTTRGGTNSLAGSFSYALRDPHLEWTADDQSTPTTFGQGYTQHQFSGGIGGPIVHDKLFYFGAFQVRRRLDPLQTITGADPLTLERLGMQPDSAERFRDLVGGYGIPLSVPSIPTDRESDNGTAIVRVDYHMNDDHSLMMRGNWQGSLQEAFRTSAFALPSHGGIQHIGGGGGMIALSSVFGNFLNELRGTYSRNLNSANPYLVDPEGRVTVTSSFSDTTVAVTQLDFGGNSGLPTDGANGQFEASDEFSWMSEDASHRFKLGALVNLTSFSSMNAFNSDGTFLFNSLSDLETNQPAMFTRSLMPTSRTGSGLNSAIYLGDTWRHSRALQVTYGLRVEGSDFQGHPAYNPEIEQLFDRRTDKFPTEVSASPRVGFTWMLGGNAGGQIPQGGFGGQGRGGGAGGFGRGGEGASGFGGTGGGFGAQPYILRGGVGEFRGTFPLPMFASALTATGLPNSQTQLVCIGDGVPTPDWAAYAADPSTIPTACANGAASGVPTIGNQRPNVTVFEPDFGAPRSWRASLGVSHRMSARLGASIDLSYALGTNLYSVRDLNLNTTTPFVLGAEGNRPVFVDPSAIVPTTGAISLLSSRLYPQYAQVLDVTSGLQSRTGQMTLSLNGVTPNDIIWNLSYTLTRSLDQSSFYNAGGFGGGGAGGGFASPTTAGDPNEFPWATSDFERRHSFVGTTTWLVKPWLDVTSVIRLTSGSPFTPRVGSDINGDGARNDRAFVFNPDDPANASDTALVNGMRRLLTNGPSAARQCLLKQLGNVAGRNSCTGSWTPSFDLQANIRPDLGTMLGRRLMISVSAINPLAGLDQLLHGADHLQGWGQPNRADPTLLYVSGFDPASKRFIYTVNDRFGDNPASRTAIRTPFQLAVSARLQVGPDRQRELLEGTLRGINGDRAAGGRGGGRGFDIRTIVNRVAPNPVSAIIAMKDTLQLTPDQVTRLQAVADSLGAKNDSLIADVEQQLAKGQGGADLAAIFPNIQPRLQQARNNYLTAVKSAQAILTPEQWKQLPDDIRNPALQRGFPRRGGARPPG
jgi:hypothetical protein